MDKCLYTLNQEAEAQPYFARAYAALTQDDWLVAHESARLERLMKLGEADG